MGILYIPRYFIHCVPLFLFADRASSVSDLPCTRPFNSVRLRIFPRTSTIDRVYLGTRPTHCQIWTFSNWRWKSSIGALLCVRLSLSLSLSAPHHLSCAEIRIDTSFSFSNDFLVFARFREHHIGHRPMRSIEFQRKHLNCHTHIFHVTWKFVCDLLRNIDNSAWWKSTIWMRKQHTTDTADARRHSSVCAPSVATVCLLTGMARSH